MTDKEARIWYITADQSLIMLLDQTAVKVETFSEIMAPIVSAEAVDTLALALRCEACQSETDALVESEFEDIEGSVYLKMISTCQTCGERYSQLFTPTDYITMSLAEIARFFLKTKTDYEALRSLIRASYSDAIVSMIKPYKPDQRLSDLCEDGES